MTGNTPGSAVPRKACATAWRTAASALGTRLAETCISRCLRLASAAKDTAERLGRFIAEDGVVLPEPQSLAGSICREPGHPLTAARAELLAAMQQHRLSPGRYSVYHRWKHASILASAFRHGVPVTVHPGIGYDIITNHPMFNGAAIGRAAQRDFAQFSAAVEGLDDGVVLSVGSAIMGPQVFEKSMSCVNNLRLQAGRPIVQGHAIYVVDIQDGGNWDWSTGEPPKSNPAYYLRFCKSYAAHGRNDALSAGRQSRFRTPPVPPPDDGVTVHPNRAIGGQRMNHEL